MLEWKGSPALYRPPTALAAPPAPPRASFEATGEDGARLEAYRWGSPLGQPFMLEIRRYGAPRVRRIEQTLQLVGAQPVASVIVRDRSSELAELEPAKLPGLDEVQAAVDQLLPPGVLVLLGLLSNGPDATYPEGEFFVVRVAQPAQQTADAGASRLVQ